MRYIPCFTKGQLNMKTGVVVVLLALGIVVLSACKKEPPADSQVSVNAALERIRVYAEEKNPEFRDQPLVVHLGRRSGGLGICSCIQVCSASGHCTACVCDPPGCTTCFTEAVFKSATTALDKTAPTNPPKK